MRGTSRYRGAATAAYAAVALLALAPPARADGGLRNGPWLLEPRTDAVTVMLERVSPGPVRVRAEPVPSVAGAPDAGFLPGISAPGPVTAQGAANTTLHEVRLVGLRPGTRYRYEVSGPGIGPGQGGEFTTAPARDDAFRFVVYGDTRSDAAAHALTVDAIVRESPAFVLHTGDLVADGRRDALWQQFFAIEHDLLRDAPLVPVIGNHEIQLPGSSGVANFRRYVHVGPPEPGAPAPDPRVDYALAYGGVRLVLANAYSDWSSAAMRAWLIAQIDGARREDPTAFVIVVMHWGPCSSGPHGENRSMRAAGIDELFREHAVDLVISGHDHIYERGDDDGLPYLVTGGGAAELYHPRHPRPYSRLVASEHHYVRADVEPGRIVFTALRADGSVIDRCPLTHDGWRCDPPAPDAATVERPPPPTRAPRRGHARAPGCGCTTVASGPTNAWRAVLLAVAAVLVRRRRRR